MSIFDTLPMFDHTIDDRALEVWLLAECFDHFDDFEIIEIGSPVITLDYGWSSYEESEGTTLGINVAELWIRRIVTGYSVYAAEYEEDVIEEYETFEDLMQALQQQLHEYFVEEEFV